MENTEGKRREKNRRKLCAQKYKDMFVHTERVWKTTQ